MLACVLHVLVHAADIAIGQWHDLAVHVLVALSFGASLLHGCQAARQPAAA